ncbi:prepilin-type N-terminal cleavage/methylation domain-containing protein [Rhizosaccharibacter radicis]|uniref:Prepilin-type N-terminal cleavage/methylation domain-containing protein n=1 Tax=Rhizosaccharibacter radicis TaxID=2782605 RepID=A0ABT1VT42_9PROT|nr:prepilin-type N-terminal cleavage/methylation domain-containing protein [Acetobacteraceae bacterium KSS12]
MAPRSENVERERDDATGAGRPGCGPDAGAKSARDGRGRRGTGDAGFTLLEIVVALVVFGVLLLSLGQGTRFGLTALDRENAGAEREGRLQAVDATLRRLVAQADPGTTVDGNTLAGTRHALVFRAPLGGGAVAALSLSSDRPDDPRGAPTGMADLRLQLDDRHRLVLFFLPYRHVSPIGPAPKPREAVLLEGLRDLDISYWSDGRWRDDWKDADLPALVRIRLVFADNRHWPDIVTAPVRDQPD